MDYCEIYLTFKTCCLAWFFKPLPSFWLIQNNFKHEVCLAPTNHQRTITNYLMLDCFNFKQPACVLIKLTSMSKQKMLLYNYKRAQTLNAWIVSNIAKHLCRFSMYPNNNVNQTLYTNWFSRSCYCIFWTLGKIRPQLVLLHKKACECY